MLSPNNFEHDTTVVVSSMTELTLSAWRLRVAFAFLIVLLSTARTQSRIGRRGGHQILVHTFPVTADDTLTIGVQGPPHILAKSSVHFHALPVYPSSIAVRFSPRSGQIGFDDRTQTLSVHLAESAIMTISISRDHLQGAIRRSKLLAIKTYIDECSDGLDNDSNGFVDAAVPRCQSVDRTASGRLEWTWFGGNGSMSGFLEQVNWSYAAQESYDSTAPVPSVVVIQDDHSDCRWWPHSSSDDCPHWKQPPQNNSGRAFEPWDFEITDGVSGRSRFENVSVQHLVSWNASIAKYETKSASVLVEDTYVLHGEAMYISTSVSLLQNTSATVKFVSNYGSFRLNPSVLWHLGNKRAGTLERNWTTIEACVYPFDGLAPMPARACMSAASAMGDDTHFSVGVQCLTPIDPDTTEILYYYMDNPRNNKWPTSTTQWTMTLAPHTPVVVGMQLQFGAPAASNTRVDVVAAMEAVVAPYVNNFQRV